MTESVTLTPVTTATGDLALVLAAQEKVRALEDDLEAARAERTVAVRTTLDAGATQQRVADAIGVTRMALHKWMHQ